MSDEKKDYTIGYGRPPAKSQFKKGESGNPQGRPKKRPTLDATVESELSSPIWIVENERRVRIKKSRAIVKRNVNDALRGDKNAMKWITESIRRSEEKARIAAERSWARAEAEAEGKIVRASTREEAEQITTEFINSVLTKSRLKLVKMNRNEQIDLEGKKGWIMKLLP